jgi:hypothetical protein
MSVTINALTEFDSDYSLVSEKYSWNIGFNPDFNLLKEPVDQDRSFYSDTPKMLMRLPISFYHCIHDFLGTLLHIFEINKSTLFIIDTSLSDRTPSASKVSEFCFKLLDYHSINYEKVNLSSETTVNLNNFYIRTQRLLDHNASNLVMQYTMPFIDNKEVKPFRKVYVSRKYLNGYKKKNYGSELSKRMTRNTYSRIDEEEKLEEFFISNGFEVVAPEDFNSFEEQLNYFYEVKTIAGITGGALTNIMFMQNGGTVIEIMTTLITPASSVRVLDKDFNKPGFEEGQHHLYHAISFRKDCNYTGIPNINTKAETVIDRIKNSLPFNFIFLEGRSE